MSRNSALGKILVIDDSPTILKVVELVLTKAGYAVVTCSDGREGLDRALEWKPDLILLDFVMPRMNGYQVCRALSESDELKSVPVVLLSAKGEQVGEQFVKIMGIVDYITKPFAPDAMLAVVEHTIAKNKAKPLVPTIDSQPLPSEVTRSVQAFASRETTAPGSGSKTPYAARRLDAFAALRESIIEAVLAGGETSHDTIDSLRSHLSDATLEKVVVPLARMLWHAEKEASVLQGDLGRVPVAEVLSLLAEQEQWGVLSALRPAVLERGEEVARIDVAFKAGKVELAFAAGLSDEFLLGRFLTDKGALAEDALNQFLRDRSETGAPLGQQLVDRGLVREHDLRAALVRQTQERMFELLRWPAGRFTFQATRELPPLAVAASLELRVDGVLIEGFRRVDEWHLIEREVDDFDAIYLRNEDAVQNLGRAQLTREELAVLELVNARNTVKDIVRQSRMSTFDVTKMLYRLLSTKLVRRRVEPVATS